MKPFVKNRVELIRAKTVTNQWYYVSSADIVADILSRGATYLDLMNSKWFDGPEWLKTDTNAWPITNPSGKDTIILAASVEMENEWKITVDNYDITNVIDPEKFSDYNKLLCTTAYVLKAFRKGNHDITATDINNAEKEWITSIQRSHYGDAIANLKLAQNNKPKVNKVPPIVQQLGLIISADGLLRCAGRVRNHPRYDCENKFPILLPRNAYITKLIILNAHKAVKHYGIGATMGYLRNQFWITSMRCTVRKLLSKCVTCRKVNGCPYPTPDAPPLPEFRLDETKPYSAVAIDFTGHLMVKEGKNIRKVYICLFTCCSTRNIHLEIVPDMTTEAFLRAFRRFCAAYSVPCLIYCDNAKTFKSSETELNRLYEIVSGHDTQKHLADKRIQFKYIPVEASWMAGVPSRKSTEKR